MVSFRTLRVLCLVVGLLSSISFGYSGGSGTAEEPYQVADTNDLLELAADTGNYDKCFILTADINLAGQVFTTAIIAADGITAFTGTFDGNGYKITNLTINGGSDFCLGLFGYIDSGGSVKNLGIENCAVTGSSCPMGGLAGYNGYGSISNCYSTGIVTGGDYSYSLGGLVGQNGGSVSNCYSTVVVTGGDYSLGLGGLVGANSGSVSNCYSTGVVTGGDYSQCLGGLLGYNERSNISNCYSTGVVTGGYDSYYVGGLVGYQYSNNVTDCYATGDVAGDYSAGGLVGYNEYGNISNCYSTGAVSGTSNVGGLVGYNTGSISGCYFLITSGPDNGLGTPLTNEQMKQRNSFIGWDFSFIWDIIEGQTYPFFKSGVGTGTPDDPYQIATKADLLAMAAYTSYYDKCFILTADIDLAGQVFTTAIIAASSSSGWPFEGTTFMGTFDGNGHKITNLTIDGGSNWYIGLFGYIDSGGSVKNLGIENCTVTGSLYTSYCMGGLAGYSTGSISNCYSTGEITGYFDVGGLVGENYSNISNCYSTVTVSGGIRVGGLVGYNIWGNISQCYTTGTVSGSIAGGLAGQNDSGNISNCYATGVVVGGSYVGGLVGNDYDGSISNCYSTGAVSGGPPGLVGGLVGYNEYGGVAASNFWDVNTSGQTTSHGGTGKTTAEMKTLSTFTSAGWDFIGETANGTNDYWRMLTYVVDYPHLIWEHVMHTPDLNGDAFVDFIDYAIFADDWQLSPDPCDPNNGDITQNGIVDIYDLAQLVEYWLTCFVTEAFSPGPSDHAANVSINAILSWSPGNNAASHDVYFGTGFNDVNDANIANTNVYMGNQDANFWDTNNYNPSGLDLNTTYYWRIDELAGCTAKGDVWSFNVPPLPGQASNPTPGNGATNVGVTTNLSWTAGSYATSHDVYFGTTNPPSFIVNQTATTYGTGIMAHSTTYYWRIDEKNPCGTTMGEVLSFTTDEPNIESGLAAWWQLDEEMGTIAYDSVGNNDGNLVNGPTWATGKIGGALSFDGTDDYVNCGSGPSNYDNITVSTWMKTFTLGALVSNRDSGGSYGTWYTLTSTSIEIGDNSQGGFRNLTFYTPTLNGTWHHIVYTKDGVNHAVYVDGSLDQSFTSNADISQNSPLFIGRRWTRSNSPYWFNGIIDDVRIYNRALTPEEVALLWQQGIVGLYRGVVRLH